MREKVDPPGNPDGSHGPPPEAKKLPSDTHGPRTSMAEDASGEVTLKTIPNHSLGRTIAIGACTTSTSIVSAMAGQAVLLLLPSIGEDLAISQHDLTWILNSYVLPYGCLLLLSGRMADIISRKYTFILGMLLFSIFTLVCGFVKDSQRIPFFVLRALAGLGASLATPASIGCISENFPPGRRRSILYAAFGAGSPIGAAVGVILGGVMASYVEHGWRKVFYILSGVAIIPMTAAFWALPSYRPDPLADKRIDFLGALLSTGGLVMLLYVMTAGPTTQAGFRTPYIIAMLVLSFALLATFICWQWYIEMRLHRPPLVRLALFTRGKGKLSVVYAFVFFNFASFSGYFLLTDLYYQQVLGLTPAKTMLRYLPTSVSGLACTIFIAFLVPYVSGQILLCTGAVMTAIAPLLFAVIKPGAIFWTNEFFAMILCVAGADFSVATGLIFVSLLCLPSEQSTAGGLFQTALNIGNAFGTGMATLVYTSVAQQRISGSVANLESTTVHGGYTRDALLKGLKVGFWVSCGLALIAFTLSALFLIGMGTVESRNKVTKPIDLEIETKDQGDDSVKAASSLVKTEEPLLPVVSRGVKEKFRDPGAALPSSV